ncbi:MAG: lamin tail domain-containing protein, partial [Gemmatimonadaceae bacterium]|nr:lamin tail domain-containing protein [Gemmatimonadaceae bacterium]
MRLPSLRRLRPIAVTLALLSCTENGPVGPRVDVTARLNAQGTSQSVVISQVYGGGGNTGATYKNDFIEIFNNGSDAVDLTGWSVQYGSAANNFSLKTTLTGTIPPGKYLLIQEAAGTGGTLSLSADIVTGTGQPAGNPINMGGTDGKVALVRNGTILTCGAAATPCPTPSSSNSIADLVGYGTSSAFEGTVLGALSNTTAGLRNNGGCSDTNNNLADFTRSAPAPRNGATAANVCSVVNGPADHVTVVPAAGAPNPGVVTVGATIQYTATVFDAANHDVTSANPVTWSTSPTGFATVNANGLATGTNAGNTAVVAAVASNASITASAPLTINPALVVQAGDIVISQIYGGGGNSGATYTNDYIELLNRGTTAVNLAGWSVQYTTASGTGTWLVHNLSGTVQPGHYFLVQEASTAAVGAALPAADASDGLNLAAGAGKVILAQTTAAQTGACPVGALITDHVGYGTTSNCGATTDWNGTTGSLSATTAAFRSLNGCRQTNNNGSDFSVAAPAPRNSASPVTNCVPSGPLPTVHFSEIHYDNSGTDVNEKIEIEGPAGTDLTGWKVVLYGGSAVPDFSAYNTTTLGVSLPTTCNSTGVIVINYAVDGIKNAKFNGAGNPAGFALIDASNQVVEFLSYEGSFAAVDGPAAGRTSVDIGVAEEPAPAPGNSLHRDSNGAWQSASAQDFGACNGSNVAPPSSTNKILFTGRLATDPALPVGFEDQLFGTEKDGATNATISTTFTWSSDTPGIASIDATGVMHAVSAGTATFRAKAADGTEATYSLPMVINTFSTTADWSGNLEFGTPTGNVQSGDVLITHDQFTSSFSKTRNIPNWVSAKIDASHYGTGSDRCDCFTYDPLVTAAGGTPYTSDVYTGEGSVWNRGHMLRSADVESSPGDNSIAYLFTNIAPQSAQMNQGPWAIEENFLGDMAKTGGKDVYVIIGVSGTSATEARLIKANVAIPAYFWKVAVIVPHGVKLADIHSYTDLQVISVIMPNIAGVNADWTTYKTTVDAVEALSGYDLLNALPDDIELLVESNDRPPVAAMTGPDAGNEGAPLSFSGSASSDPDGDALTYNWNFGDNTTATGVSPTHTFTDNGQYIVTLTVNDPIGAKSTTTRVVTVSNVSPSGSFASPAPVNEGDHFTLSINGASDPSSADVAAGFSYRFDCGDGSGFGNWTSSNSVSCFAADNPGSAVSAEVKDKDGGFAHYAGAVIVGNVAPSALFSNNGPLNEGGSFTLRLDGASDPSAADVAAGLQYRFDCGNGPGAWQLSSSALCPAADNGTFSVSGEIKDKDGAENVYSATVVVNNVAPTAEFSSNGPVNEGTSYTLTLGNGSDISSVDVSAGLEYRFDCGTGAGFGNWGSASSVNCPANDHGSYNVAGQIRDKDLGNSSYAGSVTVINTAPTALFLFTGTVNEGTPFTLALNNGTDSPSDVAAGLEYRFNCGTGSGYGGWGSATSIACPTTDNGSISARGEIRDHDGAVSTYGGTVTVNNLAPSGAFTTSTAANEGGIYTLSISGGTDASSSDVAAGFTYRFDCGTGFANWSTSNSASCAALDNPGNATRGEIRDKDGAVASYEGVVAINNVAPTAVFSNNGPVNEGSSFTLSLSGASDVSAADIAGGFTYRFNCGSGFVNWSSSPTITCTAPNHGTYNVSGEVKDKDGGASIYNSVATVNNVAPTAVFLFSGSVNEGSPFTLAFNSGTDSPADVAAGFEYRFNCGTGFGSWGTATSVSCPTTDNGTPSASGEIRDHAGAANQYNGSVNVNNVSPTVVVDPAAPIVSGTTFALSAGFADPGQNDAPWTYVINWGDGISTGSTNTQGAIAASHKYLVAGTYTVTLTVTDKDGGVGSKSITLQVNPVAGTMDATQAQINTSNNGNGIVKVTVLGNSSFSAQNIVISTVRIGNVHPATEGNGSYKVQVADVNRDGISDLVVQFVRSALSAGGYLSGPTLTLNATLTDGRQIQSVADITT